MRRTILALAVAALAVPALSNADAGREATGGHPSSCSCSAAQPAPGAKGAPASDPNFWANHFQSSVEAPR